MIYNVVLVSGVQQSDSVIYIHICIHIHMLLLSHFSRVRLCATPQTAAHQAPRSLGFSRQEHWSGLPFPSPIHESEVAQSCPTLSDPMDCSPPGSSIRGIFQSRALEWGSIAYSCYCRWYYSFFFFKWLSSIPLYICTTSSLSIHLLMDI